jgi:hypothetical protein
VSLEFGKRGYEETLITLGGGDCILARTLKLMLLGAAREASSAA